MSPVKVIALGSRTLCDDEVALEAAQRVASRAEVILAGRPGPGLVDLLDPGRLTVLVDVVHAGLPPGRVITVPLGDLRDGAIGGQPVSSHGLGPAEALRLADALGRDLPRGLFVGVQGENFDPGQGVSSTLNQALPALVAAIEAAVDALSAELPLQGARDDA